MENLQNPNTNQQIANNKKIIPTVYLIVSIYMFIKYIPNIPFSFNSDGIIVYPFLFFIFILSIISINSKNKSVYNKINYFLIISTILIFIYVAITISNSKSGW